MKTFNWLYILPWDVCKATSKIPVLPDVASNIKGNLRELNNFYTPLKISKSHSFSDDINELRNQLIRPNSFSISRETVSALKC